MKKNFGTRKKGISPLIATVLLIAFTVAVAGIVSTWVTGFTKTSTTQVGDTATSQLICSNGGIKLSDLLYCNNRISGVITNTGYITLGNITVQELYTNTSTATIYLCKAGSVVSSCGGQSNLTLTAREAVSFNISIGNSNFGTTRIFTNCSSSFYDAKSGDHSSC